MVFILLGGVAVYGCDHSLTCHISKHCEKLAAQNTKPRTLLRYGVSIVFSWHHPCERVRFCC